MLLHVFLFGVQTTEAHRPCMKCEEFSLNKHMKFIVNHYFITGTYCILISL